MKKSSLIAGIIVVVLIAAAVNFYPQQREKNRGESPRGRMFEKLDLTQDQKDKIEQFSITHQKEMIDLRADLQKKRLDMRELVRKGNFSRSDFLNIVNELNGARDKIATAKANHMMDIYSLLTDQQKKIFSEMHMMKGSGCMMDKMMKRKQMMRMHPGMNSN